MTVPFPLWPTRAFIIVPDKRYNNDESPDDTFYKREADDVAALDHMVPRLVSDREASSFNGARSSDV